MFQFYKHSINSLLLAVSLIQGMPVRVLHCYTLFIKVSRANIWNGASSCGNPQNILFSSVASHNNLTYILNMFPSTRRDSWNSVVMLQDWWNFESFFSNWFFFILLIHFKQQLVKTKGEETNNKTSNSEKCFFFVTYIYHCSNKDDQSKAFEVLAIVPQTDTRFSPSLWKRASDYHWKVLFSAGWISRRHS